MPERGLLLNQLRVGQILRQTIYETRWLILARDLGPGHDYDGLPRDHSKERGVLLRYVDVELGLGDVLQPHQLRRVIERHLVPLSEQSDLQVRHDRQVKGEPWETFERATWDGRSARLYPSWELMSDVPCLVSRDVMLERARRRRAAADVLGRLGEAIGAAEQELRSLGEQLPEEELMIVDQDLRRDPEIDLGNVRTIQRSVASHGQELRWRAADLRREAAQLDEWRRVRLP